MKQLLLAVGLLALVGCQDPMEKKVRQALLDNREVLVVDSAELRDVRKARVGESICGLVSYESNQGRTDFTPFLLRDGKIALVNGVNYQATADYQVFCSTSQPAT